jgi:phosphopantetheine adenylyltransferase
VKTIIIPQLDPLKNTISSSSLKAISQFSGDIASLANPIVREALRMKQTGKFIV